MYVSVGRRGVKVSKFSYPGRFWRGFEGIERTILENYSQIHVVDAQMVETPEYNLRIGHVRYTCTSVW